MSVETVARADSDGNRVSWHMEEEHSSRNKTHLTHPHPAGSLNDDVRSYCTLFVFIRSTFAPPLSTIPTHIVILPSSPRSIAVSRPADRLSSSSSSSVICLRASCDCLGERHFPRSASNLSHPPAAILRAVQALQGRGRATATVFDTVATRGYHLRN